MPLQRKAPVVTCWEKDTGYSLVDNEDAPPASRCWRAIAAFCRSLPFNSCWLTATSNNVGKLINAFYAAEAAIIACDSYAEAMKLLRHLISPREVSSKTRLTCPLDPSRSIAGTVHSRIQSLIDGHPVFVEEGKSITGRLVARASVTDINAV
jgi:hypothetical protein